MALIAMINVLTLIAITLIMQRTAFYARVLTARGSVL